MARITGSIVKILSEKVLVIDLGTENGLQTGTAVHVLHIGEEIKAPGDGKPLGNLEYVKAVLRVSHVQETMATCVPPSSSPQGAGSDLYRTVSSDMARIAMDRSPYGESADPLDIRSADISGMPKIPPIGVGDRVSVV